MCPPEEAQAGMSLVAYEGIEASPLDSKGRFVMPADFRSALRLSCGDEPRFFLRFSDKNPFLMAYGNAEQQEFRRESEEMARIARERGELFDRGRHDKGRGTATPVTMDAGGRFAIDRIMRQLLDITDSVVFYGADRYIEIWKPETYLEKGDPDSYARIKTEMFLEELAQKRKARGQ